MFESSELNIKIKISLVVKKVLTRDQRSLIELRRTAKPLYFASEHLATQLLLPWLDAAVASLRAAGFPRSAESTAATTIILP